MRPEGPKGPSRITNNLLYNLAGVAGERSWICWRAPGPSQNRKLLSFSRGDAVSWWHPNQLQQLAVCTSFFVTGNQVKTEPSVVW
jgi:hypothetical protein